MLWIGKPFYLVLCILNIICRIQLEIGLTNLNNTIECDELLFWGRIHGLKSDYLLAMAVF